MFHKFGRRSTTCASACSCSYVSPSKEGDFDFENKGFDYEFMDLELVYRIRVGGRMEYHPLCPATQDGLLDI